MALDEVARQMSQDGHRQVRIDRVSAGRYAVGNDRGGTISVGTGTDEDFTPVELLLAAIGGCTSIDVDILTSRRAEPAGFTVEVGAEKVRDLTGSRLKDIAVTFHVSFPDGEAGDAARELLPGAVRRSHDSLCTVGKTVELGTPITAEIA
jgi:putative redox protein